MHRSASPSSSTHSNNTSSADVPEKTLTTTITYADSGAGGFARDYTTGILSKTVSMQWPKAKSKHVWAMGESIKSELAEVSFWVKVKLIVSSSALGTISLDLEPREITIVSTNDSDRRLALAKFAEHRELVAAMREKSRDRERESSQTPGSTSTGTSGGKRSGDYVSVDSHSTSASSRRPSTSHKSTSHRKSTLERPPPSLVPSEPDPHLHGHSIPTPPSTGRSSRRPHTSAGPRDKSNLPYTCPAEPVPTLQHSSNKRNSNGQTRSGGSVRPNTGMSVNEVQIPRSSMSSNHSHKRHSRGAGPVDVGVGTGAAVGASKDDAIRAWEDEMERIDSVTKRTTSDMLSFFGLSKRRRKEKEEKREKEREANHRRQRHPKGIFAGLW
ncbi:hypothetical protein QCA50_002828 [Cerrena zonata]|uniref:Uncharacterized protein n=1 Tax=Cerrena zonata TaxID=2478898 RepID=A0AAW0GIU8_9APHY